MNVSIILFLQNLFCNISKFTVLKVDEVFLTVKRESTFILLWTVFNQKEIAKVTIFEQILFEIKEIFSLNKIHVTIGRLRLS